MTLFIFCSKFYPEEMTCSLMIWFRSTKTNDFIKIILMLFAYLIHLSINSPCIQIIIGSLKTTYSELLCSGSQ